MIQIVRTDEAELKEFTTREWRAYDVDHYGKAVDWIEEPFFLKAVEQGQIVGSASGRYTSGIVYISELLVSRIHLRRGIGRLLMEKIEQFGKKLGAHKIQLHTGRGWDSVGFYEALGFREVAQLPDHHFHKDFVIYEKYL
ncbi:MAG: GNAT family N-acetyltransferase [bacterium]|nr:GNAT family N-acetyltransferase [bacterium]